jgi:hypothetical protein
MLRSNKLQENSNSMEAHISTNRRIMFQRNIHLQLLFEYKKICIMLQTTSKGHQHASKTLNLK